MQFSSLSSQTNHATGKINEIIETIIHSIEDMTFSVENLLESRRLQNQYVDTSASNFEKIHKSTQGIFEQGIDHVYAVTQKVMRGANETLGVCNTNLQTIAHVTDIMDSLAEESGKLRMD